MGWIGCGVCGCVGVRCEVWGGLAVSGERGWVTMCGVCVRLTL